jgi:hypothetical protein
VAREQELERERKYEEVHREQRKEAKKRWRDEHRDLVRERQRGYSKKYRSSPATRAKRLETQRSWTQRNREKFEGYNLRHKCKKYGLTPGQHQAMYVAQNGCCDMCGESVPYDLIKTDHDHVTGKVRGLLCARCNVQIAIFDNYELLDKAIQYLEKTR